MAHDNIRVGLLPQRVRAGPAASLLAALLRVYQVWVSPLWRVLGVQGGCRFEPSCSEYMRQALLTHGSWRGLGLGLGRLCRCHPWGGCGHDPVPSATDTAGGRAAQGRFV